MLMQKKRIADAEKMHLCVDYFVTDSPANSQGNMTQVNFRTVPKSKE